MDKLNISFGVFALLASGLSANTARRAQRVAIQGNIDKFIDGWREQSKWKMWSAILQAATFAVLFLRLIHTGSV